MAELYGVDIVELFRVPVEVRGEGAEVLEEIVGMMDGRSRVDLEAVREALRLLLGRHRGRTVVTPPRAGMLLHIDSCSHWRLLRKASLPA